MFKKTLINYFNQLISITYFASLFNLVCIITDQMYVTE